MHATYFFNKGKLTTFFISTAILATIAFSLFNNFLFVGSSPDTQSGQVDDKALQMIKKTMRYIADNHPEATSLISTEATWSKISGVSRVGYTSQTFTSDGWTVTIGRAITARICFEVRAEHTEGIVWTGIIIEGIIIEKSYKLCER